MRYGFLLFLTGCVLDPCDSPLWSDSQDGVRAWLSGPDTFTVEIDKGCTVYPCTIHGTNSEGIAITLCADAHGIRDLPPRR